MKQSMKSEDKRQLYIEHIYSRRKDIYRILYNIFHDSFLAEEMTQGVLERAWKGLDTLKDRNKSWAWLKGIIRNETRTRMKKHAAEPVMEVWEPTHEYIGETELLQYERDILDTLVEKEAVEEVVQMLEEMDERYRTVIKLHLITGFSLKEISEIEGIEYSTVRSLYSRGIRKLRDRCLSLEKGGSGE